MNKRFVDFPRLIPVDPNLQKHGGTSRHDEMNDMHIFVAGTIALLSLGIGGFIWIGLHHSWFLALCSLLVVPNLASLILSRFQSYEVEEEREIAHLQSYGYCPTASALFGKATAVAHATKQRKHAARQPWNMLAWPSTFWLTIRNLPAQLDRHNQVDPTVKRELYLLWMVGLTAVAIPLVSFIDQRTLAPAIWTVAAYFSAGTALWVDFTTRFDNN